VDPIVQQSIGSADPFTWIDCVADNKLMGSELKVIHEARDFGLKEGADIPIHGPGFEIGSFSVHTSLSMKQFQERWAVGKTWVSFIAYAFYNSFKRLNEISDQVTEIHLSPRERECLLWSARGKTVWETGQILSISDQTVLTHIGSARSKLGAGSKQHAVIKAILSQLIRP